METIFIGPCKCGGYGLCYNAETEAKTGKCHLTSDELRQEQKQANDNLHPVFKQALAPFIGFAEDGDA